ncbi:hypothetical protein BDA96_01G190100 [Sorghum bicolor]|jgi:hypothetical protein|uniref:Uncharacterized protein n=1 Tax=Sorghum bicolor TaxID=4558 RepID=A0A921RYD4_SORBI|nr:hypothetical protein BDA96_01G190100 [Sorghum bicolor]
MGLRPQGQGSSFSTFRLLPAAAARALLDAIPHRNSTPVPSTKLPCHPPHPQPHSPPPPPPKGSSPTRRRPNAPGLSWPSSRPPRPHPLPSLTLLADADTCGRLPALGGEGGTVPVRRGGNQASRGWCWCSTDGMPRGSAVLCNLLVRLGQGI